MYSTLLGAVGIAGLAVLVCADLVLVWTPAKNLDVFRAAEGKSDARVVAGALTGVLVIPLVLAGVASLFRPLEPAGPWLAWPPVLLAAFAYVVGAGFHAAVGLYLLAIRETPPEARGSSKMLAAMARIFRPLQTLLWTSIFAASTWLLVALVSGGTAYPRWVAWVSPLPVVLAFRVAGRLGPPALAGAAVPAGGNLAMLCFLVVSLLVLR